MDCTADFSFLLCLAQRYEVACRGIHEQPLTIDYWVERSQRWCLQFHWQSEGQGQPGAVHVFALPRGLSAVLARDMQLQVGTLRLVGQGKKAVEFDAPPSPLLSSTRAALEDLCAPCACVAGDEEVLHHFPTLVRCVCRKGWLAALQRSGSCRCPFTRQEFGADKTPQHPSWTRWIARWHAERA